MMSDNAISNAIFSKRIFKKKKRGNITNFSIGISTEQTVFKISFEVFHDSGNWMKLNKSSHLSNLSINIEYWLLLLLATF